MSKISIYDTLNQSGAAFSPNASGMWIDENRRAVLEFIDIGTRSDTSQISQMKRRYADYASKGLRAFSIFEHEWKSRPTQITNYILASLGIFHTRLFARQCVVSPCDWSTAKDFLDQHHIQGAGRIDIAFGIASKTDSDRLEGVVAFGRHHRQDQYLPVLTRLCFSPGRQIVGGASKLVTHAIRDCGFRKVVTWSDNRLSVGRVYEKMGFKDDGQLPPDYIYSNGSETRSKQSMKKSNTGCPPEVTELQWAQDHGWWRLYDAGKRRFIWVKRS